MEPTPRPPAIDPALLARGRRVFERSFLRRYDLRITGAERLRPGRVIYVANHFHHFDPLFVLYAVTTATGALPRQLAKPSLYRLPLIGKAMKNYRTIMTPRPAKGEELTFEDYERLKLEVREALAADEAVSVAYAGTMTDNFGVDPAALAAERAAAHHGLFTLSKGVPGIAVVPVAVDIYQKRSPRNVLRAVLDMTGITRLLPVRRKTAVDMAFGAPILIDDFLASTSPETGRPQTRRQLVDAAVLAIHALRVGFVEKNAGDPARALERYR